MIRNLRYTIQSVLELYRLKGKQWFSFNFYFLILANLFALLLMLVCYFISDGVGANASKLDISNFLEFFQNQNLKLLTAGIIILTKSFSAIHLFFCEFSEEPQQPSVYTCYQAIGKRQWSLFFMSLIILMLLNFFVTRLELNSNFNSLMHSSIENEHQYFALVYLKSFTNYLLSYLPFIMSGIIVISYFNQNLTLSLIRKYSPALSTILIFGFISLAVISEIQVFIDAMIVGLLRIVFTESIAVYLFSFVAYILIAAFLMLIYSSTFLYPVWYEFQNIQQLEKSETQFNTSADEMSEM